MKVEKEKMGERGKFRVCVRKRKKGAKKEVNSHSVGDTFVLLSGRAFFRFVKAGTTWLISQKRS